MIFWHDKDGYIVSAAYDRTARSGRDDDPAYTRIEGPEVADINAHYVQDGQVLPKPPEPSRHHRFDYPSKTWVLDEGEAWKALRRQRDAKLAACDWVVTRAQEEGTPVPPEWREYRQALRDITDQADPCAIEWPTPPA